jgi:hypothetical protein
MNGYREIRHGCSLVSLIGYATISAIRKGRLIMRPTAALALGLCITSLACLPSHGQDAKQKGAEPDHTKALHAARDKGLEWLTRNQAKDGSWGKTHAIAVTSFACLAYLSASTEPFDGAGGKPLLKGLEFLLSKQKDGMFAQQGHSWIHGQGFATLALSEAYGRSLFCKVKPDVDMMKVRGVVARGVKIIGDNQSNSGGWWYTPGSLNQHEGSTTVCAVQALVSAQNFGIPINERVLDRGFDYLKQCQTKQGGFNYTLGDNTNMKEGTAAAIATLGLMQKFDNQVMLNGFDFLEKVTPAVISKERFPYYGHFYGCMGMHLLFQEFKGDKTFESRTTKYIQGAQKDLLSWQQQDGSFPIKGWIKDGNQENTGYSTAFALIGLQVTDGRLSIHNRIAPKLPKETPR